MNTTPSILFLIDQLITPHAGTEKQALLLIELLHNKGIKVRLCLLRESPFSKTLPSTTPYPIDHLHIKKIRSIHSWKKL